MERVSKAQRKHDKETAQMTKTESRQDGTKGYSLIGKTVTFKVFRMDPVHACIVPTGKQQTGRVVRWDDPTQTLQVQVDDYPTTYSVRLEHLC